MISVLITARALSPVVQRGLLKRHKSTIANLLRNAVVLNIFYADLSGRRAIATTAAGADGLDGDIAPLLARRLAGNEMDDFFCASHEIHENILLEEIYNVADVVHCDT